MLLVIVGGAFLVWKSGMLNNLGGGGGGGTTTGGETAYAGPGGPNVDVAGNGCACSNGKCIGNCSQMDSGGLNGMSPKEYVKSKVPGAFYAHRAYRSTWGWGW